MDDILVWGTNISDHNICLQQVMERLRQHGVTLNGEKSVFYQTSVDYLGHTISPHGIKPTKERIEAILKLDVPRNQKELRSYLGVIGFILKYIPCSHDLLKPMYDLLKGDSEWFWGPDQQKSLENLQCVLEER
jgi:Reverse transcriptase (RNA-dependent DNA polymerase).